MFIVDYFRLKVACISNSYKEINNINISIINQATDLLMKGKIETTVAKAKYLKSYVEKIVFIIWKKEAAVYTTTAR